LIIKTTFKSHFKIKTSGKSKKKILIKNIIIFIFLTKLFLKNFHANMFFNKYYKNVISVLKAPCRHKKFFHKLVYEYYVVNITYRYKKNIFFRKVFFGPYLFSKLNKFYNRFGTTSLCRTKILIILPTIFENFFKIL